MRLCKGSLLCIMMVYVQGVALYARSFDLASLLSMLYRGLRNLHMGAYHEARACFFSRQPTATYTNATCVHTYTLYITSHVIVCLHV